MGVSSRSSKIAAVDVGTQESGRLDGSGRAERSSRSFTTEKNSGKWKVIVC